MRSGTLSRWILPYGNDHQSVAMQASQLKEAKDNVPDHFRPQISNKEINYLVQGANSVRKLIRVKIADDNDLNQAMESLRTVAKFFRRVVNEAKDMNVTPYALLSLRRRVGTALPPSDLRARLVS